MMPRRSTPTLANPMLAALRVLAVTLVALASALPAVLSVAPPALAQPGAVRRDRKARDAAADSSVAPETNAPTEGSEDGGALDSGADPGAAPLPSSASPGGMAARRLPVVPESAGAPVNLHNAALFTVRVPLRERTAEQRARAANQALEKVVEGGGPTNVHSETEGDLWVVYVGSRPIIELGPDDAAAAGEAALRVHAESIANKIADGLHAEQKRHSLLMMGLELLGASVAGLVALFLALRIGRLGRKATAWMREHPDRIPALRVQTIAIVRPSTLRILLSGSLRLLIMFAQLSIAYGWLLLSLYVFEPTRGYTERLADMVLSPVSSAMGKLAGSVPSAIGAIVGIAAVVVLIRFVGVYFASASRGETTIEWLPPDLIAPTSLVVRFGILVVFVVVLLPFVTGNQDGVLSRVGLVVLISLGIATTPLLASACMGIVVMYGRGIAVGDFAVIGPFSGRIEAITMLEVRMKDADGGEIRIPHLVAMFHATRVLGRLRPVSTTLWISAATAQGEVRRLLADTAATVGVNPRVELLAFDSQAMQYRICVYSDLHDAQHRLLSALADSLAEHHIPLGVASSARA